MIIRALVVGALALAGCDRVFSVDFHPDAPVDPDAPVPSDWIQIAAGDDTTCALREGGSL